MDRWSMMVHVCPCHFRSFNYLQASCGFAMSKGSPTSRVSAVLATIETQIPKGLMMRCSLMISWLVGPTHRKNIHPFGLSAHGFSWSYTVNPNCCRITCVTPLAYLILPRFSESSRSLSKWQRLYQGLALHISSLVSYNTCGYIWSIYLVGRTREIDSLTAWGGV